MRGRRRGERGRRDGCRMNRFVVGSSEGMAKTEGKRKSTQRIKKCYLWWLPGDMKENEREPSFHQQVVGLSCIVSSQRHTGFSSDLPSAIHLMFSWKNMGACLQKKKRNCWKITYFYNLSPVLHIFQVKAIMFLYFMRKSFKMCSFSLSDWNFVTQIWFGSCQMDHVK